MESLDLFLIFFGMVIFGEIFEVILAKVYYFVTQNRHKDYHFSIGKYIYYLLLPLTATIVVVIISGEAITLLKVFIAFSIVGAILEWLIGWSYHQIMGNRLWTYNYYSIGGYTSFLSLPLWGLAGILFWVLANVFI